MTNSASTCVDLRALVVLSIRPAIRGSTTLLQFRGVGHKLALTAARGSQRFKEWSQAVSYKGQLLRLRAD